MKRTYLVVNERPGELDVWLEPWCHPYRVPDGSTLTFRYEASEGQGFQVETVATGVGLTVWLDSDYEPDVELDGSSVEPWN